MIIKFANEKEFSYIAAYTLDNDAKDGIVRPSIEIQMPIGQTSYDEMDRILTNEELMFSFTLVGDLPELVPVYKEQVIPHIILDGEGNETTVEKVELVLDELGHPIIDHYEQPDPVEHVYEGYTILGKRSIEDGIFSFKMYRLSDIELENIEARQAIDELLMAMEV